MNIVSINVSENNSTSKRVCIKRPPPGGNSYDCRLFVYKVKWSKTDHCWLRIFFLSCSKCGLPFADDNKPAVSTQPSDLNL